MKKVAIILVVLVLVTVVSVLCVQRAKTTNTNNANANISENTNGNSNVNTNSVINGNKNINATQNTNSVVSAYSDNSAEMGSIIQLTSPKANANVTSPINGTGQAKGNWFFEAEFPVQLETDSGTVIGQGIARAQGNWMTDAFVPFTFQLSYSVASTSRSGWLMLSRNNPSGLPTQAAVLRVPVTIAPATR